MSYNFFCDLHNSEISEDRISHDFLILLLDQLFDQHDNIRIDMDTESEHNHEIIKLQWKMITKYYELPVRVKNNQKLVRQTILQITNRLNQKYRFTHPLKFEHERRDYYDKEQKRKITERWNVFKLY
jgi:hypothetical protein